VVGVYLTFSQDLFLVSRVVVVSVYDGFLKCLIVLNSAILSGG